MRRSTVLNLPPSGSIPWLLLLCTVSNDWISLSPSPFSHSLPFLTVALRPHWVREFCLFCVDYINDCEWEWESERESERKCLSRYIENGERVKLKCSHLPFRPKTHWVSRQHPIERRQLDKLGRLVRLQCFYFVTKMSFENKTFFFLFQLEILESLSSFVPTRVPMTWGLYYKHILRS